MTHDSAEQISLLTADGETLAGDLWTPPSPVAAAVVCHPHPAYGGDRRNVVVDALFHSLADSGVAVLRFDFRRTGRPGPGGGTAERADVVAAVHRLASAVDLDVPLYLAGYSFGADVALAVGDDRHAGWALVAPPFRFSGPPCPGAGDDRPVLVVVAEHDQFAPPPWVERSTAAWPGVTIEVAPMADHFLAGATGVVARTVTDWVVARAAERRG